MPQRFLKPGLTSSRRYCAVSWPAKSLYISLLTLVDDYSRYEADPLYLSRMAFPFGDPNGKMIPEAQLGKWLAELAGQDLLVLYPHGDKCYLQLRRWTERPRSQSRYPAPPDGLPADASGCQPVLSDVGRCAQPPANAASKPSSSSSSSPSSREREKGDLPGGSDVAAAKLQWGALNQRIEKVAPLAKAGELSASEAEVLKKMRAARDAIQQKQARGDWSLTDLGEFGL